MSIRIERAPLGHLQDVLPRLLSSLSIGRAQIALEQIRSNLQNRPHDEVLFYVARAPVDPDPKPTELLKTEARQASPVLAALIAIQQPSPVSSASSDVVTLVHAGVLIHHALDRPEEGDRSGVPGHSPQPDESTIIQRMRDHLNQDLQDRGVRFIQWASDAADQVPLHAQRWHEGLGFEQIATLDYLAADLSSSDPAVPSTSAEPGAPMEMQFHRLSWDHAADLSAFTQLVEATYADTLDCPKLAEYRTTSDTLRGYQAASSFAPDLWFEVRAPRHSGNEPIGCMILAQHGPCSSNDEPPSSKSHVAVSPHQKQAQYESQDHAGQSDPEQASGGPVVEIVYMGLVPAARGNGFGKILVDQAAKVVLTMGGSRLILGVDRRNQPARDIYRQQGMSEVLSETVWVRKVKP